MVDVFSINDILIAVFFIVPGFIAVGLFKHLALVEKELSELEIVAWSIFLSLIVYVTFLAYSGVSSVGTLPQQVEALQQRVFQWQQVLTVIILAIAIGAIPGLIVKYIWRRGLRPGNLWDLVIKKVNSGEKYPHVRVHTENDVYEGVLYLWGLYKSPKDILILKPMKINFDPQTKAESDKIPAGKEMYFTEASYKQIDFLDSVTYKTDSKKK
jgi:hypothetical protein